MNYYSHHIGDYDSATAHLTWLEDAAYMRMIRLYYRLERPLPLDIKAVWRLTRATSKQERQAVEVVLAEFFERRDDGWHQARCDAEIAALQGRVKRNQEVGKLGGRPRKTPQRGAAGEGETETQMVSENNPDGLCAETQMVSKKNPPNLQPPTSNLQPLTPIPGSRFPDSSHSEQSGKALRVTASSEKSAAAPSAHDLGAHKTVEPKTAATWAAYAAAYTERWHVEPVRNRKTNALLAHLVDRVGAAEAPHVAAWYVTSSAAIYVRSKHCVDLLLRDCEGLRTEWATKTRMTDTEARQADQHQASSEAVRWVEEALERRPRHAVVRA